MGFDYQKMQQVAIEKIEYFGKDIQVVVENNQTNICSWQPATETVYSAKAVFIPPVNGIYFQGTRFGTHTVTEEELRRTVRACIVSPIFNNGVEIPLTDVIAIIEDNVRYDVTFSDTLRPSTTTMFYAFGVGR